VDEVVVLPLLLVWSGLLGVLVEATVLDVAGAAVGAIVAIGAVVGAVVADVADVADVAVLSGVVAVDTIAGSGRASPPLPEAQAAAVTTRAAAPMHPHLDRPTAATLAVHHNRPSGARAAIDKVLSRTRHVR
jgi:hypothetical protein